MNIGFFFPRLAAGGAEFLGMQVANQLHKLGHDIHVIVGSDGAKSADVESSVPVHVLNAGSLASTSRALADATFELKIIFLISFLETANLAADLSIVAHRQTATVINTWHGFWGSIRGVQSKAAYLGLGALSRICAMNVAVSHSLARQLVQFGCPRSKLTVIHNGILVPVSVQSYVHDKPFIFTAGSLVKQKSQDTLIRAFARFRESRDWDLLIAGSGPRERNLINLVNVLGLEHHVHFLGFKKDLNPYFAGARMFVLPSSIESFGLVIAEALACGTPVIATDCGGPREVLENGLYGRLVPPRDANAMAAAMLDFATRGHLKERLIDRARHFSIERTADEYLGLCTHIFNSGGKT